MSLCLAQQVLKTNIPWKAIRLRATERPITACTLSECRQLRPRYLRKGQGAIKTTEHKSSDQIYCLRHTQAFPRHTQEAGDPPLTGCVADLATSERHGGRTERVVRLVRMTGKRRHDGNMRITDDENENDDGEEQIRKLIVKAENDTSGDDEVVCGGFKR